MLAYDPPGVLPVQPPQEQHQQPVGFLPAEPVTRAQVGHGEFSRSDRDRRGRLDETRPGAADSAVVAPAATEE